MGLFGFVEYKNKRGEVFWLHAKERVSKDGRVSKVYFFTKESDGAEMFMPPGYTICENPKTGLPFIKKSSGLLDSILGPPPKTGKKTREKKESVREG